MQLGFIHGRDLKIEEFSEALSECEVDQVTAADSRR